MTTTQTSYGRILLGAIERARTITSTCTPVPVRRAEIIDLALQGLTVPQMRALWVAHFSGQPLPRGLRRPEVVKALRDHILTTLTQEA